jgi:UDP-GlcNAc:undecaprenyl-phosphate GlcNAc-1-phosphate transferase
MNFYLILLIILTIYSSIIIAEKSFKISSTLKLYKTKGNKVINRTPLTGGLILIVAFLIALFSAEKNYLTNNSYWIITILLTFAVGFIDDKFQIKYYLRLFGIYFFILMMLFVNDKFLIEYLYFSSIQKTFFLNEYKFFITALFILLLLNSLNMTDGINGNCSIIFMLYLFLLFNPKNEMNIFLYFLIPAILIFLFYNLNNKIYLGDSGVYFLSLFISFYCIATYKLPDANLSSEKIFLIFMIPGIDMFRLFFLRIVKKKNPFYGDLNHLHHLLINKFSLKISLIIYSSLILFPFLILNINIANISYLIIANIIIYITLVFYLKY